MTETFQDRVRKRVEELGLQPVVAARDAGLERTFIIDIIKPDGKKSVRGASLPKLAKALQTSVEYLTFQTDDPGPRAAGSGQVSSPSPRIMLEELPAGDAFSFAKIDGSVQAGAFLAVEAFDDDLGEVISAPRDPLFPFARQVAHKVKGDSMNQAEPQPMRDGDYIICAAWEDLGLKEKNGLNVVVQQTTADGQLRERSVKELRVFPDHVEFHPRSSNPAHKPIIVNREYHTDDGKEVTILSLVRFVFNNQALPV
jgi:SOS-response transcriptional repressor LexA